MNFVLLNRYDQLLGILLIQQREGGWPQAGRSECELHTLGVTSPTPPDPLAQFLRDHAGACFGLTVSYVDETMTAVHATGDGWTFEAHAGGVTDGWSICRGQSRHAGRGYFLGPS